MYDNLSFLSYQLLSLKLSSYVKHLTNAFFKSKAFIDHSEYILVLWYYLVPYYALCVNVAYNVYCLLVI